MKIICHGASSEVGRSAFLVEDRNTRIVLDYGVKLEQDRTQSFPMPIKGYIDAVILSHAHLDHCGALPLLYQKSESPCFLTPPTLPITQILLADSLKIAKLNKTSLPFSEDNVKNYVRNCRPTKYKKTKSIGSDFKFEFIDAGHILGASAILLYGEDYKIAYTGDIKLEDTEMHKGCKWPKQNFDVLMTETTYSTDHPPRKELVKEFIDAVEEQLSKGRPVICPSFALGRTQELLTIFKEHDLGVPVYLDGMGKAISEIYVDYLNYIKNGNEFMGALNSAKWVTNHFARNKAIKEPNIIVTTSGMLNGGPVADYLLKLRGKEAAIFMTGYQVKGTPGRTLLETGKFISNGKTLDLSNCEIRKYDFSAHAGISGLKTIARRSNPKLIIAEHGDKEDAEEYKRQVEEEFGFNVIVPTFGQKINVEEMI